MKKKDKFKDRYPEEIYDRLPGPISSLRVQKKNTTRFSIFVEDEFLIGISDATLTFFNIRKGLSLTKDLLSDIIDYEEQFRAKDYMISMLGRRDHSRKELYLKAIKKGFESEYLDTVLDELETKGYLNDQVFAVKFAKDKFNLRSWGPHKIRSELASKGIYGSMADRAIEQALTKDEVVESMYELIAKKRAHYLRKDPESRRKKIFDFLQRKGYDTSIIFKHLDELLEKVES